MCAILALGVARFFFNNALRVWESMVLGIGKEIVNLPIYMML